MKIISFIFLTLIIAIASGCATPPCTQGLDVPCNKFNANTGTFACDCMSLSCDTAEGWQPGWKESCPAPK